MKEVKAYCTFVDLTLFIVTESDPNNSDLFFNRIPLLFNICDFTNCICINVTIKGALVNSNWKTWSKFFNFAA